MHPHRQSVGEDYIDTLVRRVTQSVIEPPGLDQGLPVATALTKANRLREFDCGRFSSERYMEQRYSEDSVPGEV